MLAPAGRIACEHFAHNGGLLFDNQILAEQVCRLVAAQHIRLSDDLVAKWRERAAGLNAVFGAALSSLHRALFDNGFLVLGELPP